jgi:hypothetical protein
MFNQLQSETLIVIAIFLQLQDWQQFITALEVYFPEEQMHRHSDLLRKL